MAPLEDIGAVAPRLVVIDRATRERLRHRRVRGSIPHATDDHLRRVMLRWGWGVAMGNVLCAMGYGL